jgi:hypothetical protein
LARQGGRCKCPVFRGSHRAAAALGNRAANALRDQALAALQGQDSGLQISFTVPVMMGSYPIDAATAADAQVASVLGLSADAAWSRIAVTPMIGVNDVTDEVFTLADARQLAAFAASKHLAWLSMWSAARDTGCSGGAQPAAQPMCSSIAQSPGAFATALGAY